MEQLAILKVSIPRRSLMDGSSQPVYEIVDNKVDKPWTDVIFGILHRQVQTVKEGKNPEKGSGVLPVQLG